MELSVHFYVPRMNVTGLFFSSSENLLSFHFIDFSVNNRGDHLELQGSVIGGICKVDLLVIKLICD